jgi:leader peptidase (prepilin peptidase) / N-methyltransferase
MSTTMTAVAVAALCALAGYFASEIARKRNRAQPIDVDVAAEERLLELLDGQVGQWARVHLELRAGDFTSSERRQQFELLAEARSAVLLDGDLAAMATAAKRHDHSGIAAVVAAIDQRVGEERRIDETELLEAGGTVLGLSESRRQNGRHSPFVETGDRAHPLVRAETPRRTLRSVGAVLAGAVGGAVAAVGGLNASDDTAAQIWYIAALAAVVVGGIAVSLIDLDTYYLDYWTFWTWAAASWALLSVAAVIDGGRTSVLYGALGAVGVAVGFEVIAWLWGKFRGITQGAGDTLIVLVSGGVPGAAFADWRVAVWSVLFASGGVFAQWFYLTARGRGGMRTPVPFGPYLVAGAIAAVALYLAVV